MLILKPTGMPPGALPEEFIPDGDLLPLPHTRTQLCHYALRLTQPVQLGGSGDAEGSEVTSSFVPFIWVNYNDLTATEPWNHG